MRNLFEDGLYWFRRRFVPEYQHHIVRTGLEPGWHDCDEVMMHACFKLLERYVESECGGADELDRWSADLIAKPDPNAPEGVGEAQAERQLTATELYRWWKVDRPARVAREDELVQDLYGRKWGLKALDEPHEVLGVKVTQGYGPLEPPRDGDEEKRAELDEIEERSFPEDQRMLHRLIDIRGSLWT